MFFFFNFKFDEILGDIIDLSIFKELQLLQLINFIFFNFSNSFEDANQLSKIFLHFLQFKLIFNHNINLIIKL